MTRVQRGPAPEPRSRGPWAVAVRTAPGPGLPEDTVAVDIVRAGGERVGSATVRPGLNAVANGRCMAAAPELEKAAKRACVALTTRYGHDGPLEEAYEEVQREYGGAVAEAYRALREALDRSGGQDTVWERWL